MKITIPDANPTAAAGADHLIAEVERLQRENVRLRRLLAWRLEQDGLKARPETKH